MDLAIAAAVFPIIFVAELPDKTMFASLLMATRGRPSAVWVGAALAFTIHVGIAVTVGATLFAVLPHRLVDAVVAVLFLGGAIFAFRDSFAPGSAAGARATRIAGARRTIAAAFIVIFLAEWGGRRAGRRRRPAPGAGPDVPRATPDRGRPGRPSSAGCVRSSNRRRRPLLKVARRSIVSRGDDARRVGMRPGR